jgi:release factor glutamine methyltransferase
MGEPAVLPSTSATTARQALIQATETLSAARILSPRLDAEVLLAHVLGHKRAWLYARPEFTLSDEQREAFLSLVERRRGREPVPYMIGQREFYGLDFVVDRRVLIPRPETELLVERALETARRKGARWPQLLIGDIGTGSGIVAVSLAVHLPGAKVYATDACEGALQVAAVNTARHGVADRVHLLEGPLLQPLPERVQVMVANLPYVPTGVLASLAPDVIEYEPLAALNGGADGLVHIRGLVEQAGEWLLPEGAVLLEIGDDQGEQVVSLARECYPTARVELFQDYAGLDRVVRVEIASSLRSSQ